MHSVRGVAVRAYISAGSVQGSGNWAGSAGWGGGPTTLTVRMTSRRLAADDGVWPWRTSRGLDTARCLGDGVAGEEAALRAIEETAPVLTRAGKKGLGAGAVVGLRAAMGEGLCRAMCRGDVAGALLGLARVQGAATCLGVGGDGDAAGLGAGEWMRGSACWGISVSKTSRWMLICGMACGTVEGPLAGVISQKPRQPRH
jgi:hypothetical protein